MSITLTDEQAKEIQAVLAKFYQAHVDTHGTWPGFAIESAISALNAGRLFPIQDGPAVPWSVMAPHEAQCKKNHGQTLGQIAARGGFWSSEAYAVVHGIGYVEISTTFKARWRAFVDSLSRPAPTCGHAAVMLDAMEAVAALRALLQDEPTAIEKRLARAIAGADAGDGWELVGHWDVVTGGHEWLAGMLKPGDYVRLYRRAVKGGAA